VLSDYIAAAMNRAVYKQLAEDGSYFGNIPGLDGVWANADSAVACESELREVLEEWIVIRLAHQLPIPPVDGHSIAIQDVA
jgi:predicted RNase H-like HicB family nuclease